MSEVAPYHPETMAIDVPVAIYERMILEAVIEDHTAALCGLMYAYELALRNRYPFKEL